MKKWFVLHTKSKNELKVVDALTKIGIHSYCPTVKVIKQYSDRRKKIEKPIMPSYVMVLIEEYKRNYVFSVPGIIRYMFWQGKPAIVQENEIDRMKKYLEGNYANVSISNFVKGQFYKVPEGPLAGNMGKISEIKKNKVKLELKSLGMVLIIKPLAA